MCAQTLKESDRKCEHSFAELSGAPSAHPSGGEIEFQNEELKKKHRGQSKFSLFGDGLKGSNPVHALAVALAWPIVSEATLSQIWHKSVKTCRLVETRRHILGQAKLPRKMRPRNILGEILIENQ